MNRRTYLSVAGAGLTTALSGCGGASGADGSPPDNTPGGARTARSDGDDTEPNGVPRFEVIGLDVPDEITQPDTVDVELTVENTGGARGRYRGELDIAVDGVFLPTAVQYDREIRAGERATLTETLDPAHAGFVTFSIAGIERELMVIPERTRPQIQGVELLREWNEYRDVYQNAIDSAPVGGPIVIGVRYWYWHGDSGRVDVSVEYETEAEDGSRRDVIRDRGRSERIVSQRGWEPRETHIEIPTFRWETGAYTTRVRMRDQREGGTSTIEEVTYTLDEPR